jgi:hypothetical protein
MRSDPTTVLAIQQLKVAATYNQPLLGVDPSVATRRSVLGVALYSSPAVDPTTVWGIPKAKSFVVMRNDPQLAVDSSAFFSSDRTALRLVTRVSFGWPHPQAVVKISVGGS